MPNLKKEVIDTVIKKLEDEKQVINWDLQRNKYKFKELIEEQTNLKRQRVVLQGLILSLNNKSKSS